MRISSAIAHAALTSIIAFTIASAANAQEVKSPEQARDADSGTSDDIVVTAQRREQSLLQVPVAISAVGGAALEKGGIQDTTDLVTMVPNLNVTSGYGNAQPNPPYSPKVS